MAPDGWLPTDLFDSALPVPLFTGCNHLRCSACNEPVRSWIAGAVREYACRCQQAAVGYGIRSVCERNTFTEDIILPWECAGHPPLELPAKLAGIELRRDTDWKALARQVFHNPIDDVPHPKAKETPGFFLARLYNVVDDVTREAVSLAIAELLVDSDVRSRVGALTFFVGHSRASGAERVAEALRDHPDLFQGAAWDAMEEALACRIISGGGDVSPDPLALQLLKKRALRKPGVHSVLHTFRRQEAAWLSANADAILEAAPARWDLVLYVLRGTPRHAELRRAIVERGYATQAEVEAEIVKPS